jgi:hypothetical protein
VIIPLEIRTTILPGHRIEIQDPNLPEGSLATVVILVDEPKLPRRRFSEVLGDYRGGELFRTAQEVDEYLRTERNSWDS